MTHAHGPGTFPDDQTADPTTAGGTHGPEGAHRSEAGSESVVPVVSELSEAQVDAADDAAENLAAQVEQPAKVMRIGTMIKQLLEEVRAAPLDEAGRRRLAEIHASSIRELESGLAPELRDELDRLTLPFATEDDHVPSEPELRIAQAQLVGWLEGLFHGIQTAMVAQQMVARQQLEELRRRALPAGSGGQGGAGGPGQQTVIVGPGGQILGPGPGGFGTPPSDDGQGTGQYL